MNGLCKIDHALPGTIPPEFCRSCHPELNMSDQQRKEADAKERKEAKKAAALARKQREADKLARELAAPSMVKAREGSVQSRIKKSQEKKLAKLRRELIRKT